MSGKSKQRKTRSQQKSTTSTRTPLNEPTAKQLETLDELKRTDASRD